MAVLTTNLFLILLTICLVNEKLLVRAGYKLLALFVLFTTLRFVLPIELPFTITFKLPDLFSQIIAKCHSRLFYVQEQPISLWQLFKLIWLLGFLIGLAIHLFSYYRSAQYITLYGKDITEKEPYKEFLNTICVSKKRPNHFRVIELPGLDVPALFGILHPRILIPENFTLPRKQMMYILQHEATHHFNHDLILKNIIKIITLAYWWDLFSPLLNRQTDVTLEMRTDDSLTLSDNLITQEYMQCLIDISERASEKRLLAGSLTAGILPSGYKDLKRRFHLMADNQTKTRTPWSILLFGIALSIYLLSYTVILEGYTPANECIDQMLLTDSPPQDTDQLPDMGNLFFPSTDNSYFIDNLDGTYDFYMSGRRWETVDSLKYYPEGIPIYTPDTAPEQEQ